VNFETGPKPKVPENFGIGAPPIPTSNSKLYQSRRRETSQVAVLVPN